MTSTPEAPPHDWITEHRLRMAAPIAAKDRRFPPAEGASVWRSCPQHTPGQDGLVTLTCAIWCGPGIRDSHAVAEAMFADPGAPLPGLAAAVAGGHAIASPVALGGKLDWRGLVEDGDPLARQRESATT